MMCTEIKGFKAFFYKLCLDPEEFNSGNCKTAVLKIAKLPLLFANKMVYFLSNNTGKVTTYIKMYSSTYSSNTDSLPDIYQLAIPK